MKEIKFRAWDNFGKGWKADPFTVSSDGKRIYWDDGQDRPWLSEVVDSAERYGMTLSQYTGLKDKNGKEIYEGDIIGLKYGYLIYKSIVKFGWADDAEQYGSSYGWYTDSLDTNERVVISQFNDNWQDENEVIGNIYENQELLRGRVLSSQ